MKNYLKHVYDTDTWVGVKHKPLHNGLPATRTECGYKPEVKIDGQWWTTKDGTILDDDFSNGIGDWTAYNAVVTIENDMLKVDDTGNSGGHSSAVKAINYFVIGKKYTIVTSCNSSTDGGHLYIQEDSTPNGNSIIPNPYSGAGNVGTNTYTFIATASTLYVMIGVSSDGISLYDNIQIFETDIEKDQPLPKQAYVHLEADLPIDKPVDLDRKDFPTLTEPYIATEKLEAREVIADNLFGQNQTWVDVTDERALRVEYINDTNKPIILMILVSNSGADTVVIVDGVTFRNRDVTESDERTMNVTVPVGSTYLLNYGSTLSTWIEFR